MSHYQRKLLNPPASISEASADEMSPLNPIPGRLALDRIEPGRQIGAGDGQAVTGGALTART